MGTAKRRSNVSLQVTARRVASLPVIAIALLQFGGCEKTDSAAQQSSNIERLKTALPGARVEAADAQQLKKLGPAAVPGIIPGYLLIELRKRALAGDAASAYQLYHHYNLVGNDAEAQVWIRIGADNGEYNSMMLMGFDSEQRSGLEGCVRAVYWFTRARGNLKNELKSAGTVVGRPDLDALIRSADDEIAHARSQQAGC